MKGRFILFILIGFCTRVFSQQCTVSLNISSTGTAICSGNSVTLTADATSGTPPYKYLWNTGETTQSINVNKAGTFSVTVSDNTAGCKGVTQNITISRSTTPATPSANDVTTCPNSSVTLTATAPGGFYQWYDAPAGGNMVGSGASYTTPALTGSRTYYVETTISECTSFRKAVNINVVNNINVNDAYICGNNTATLSAGGAANYAWYDAATGGKLLSTSSSYTTPVLNTTTTYYVIGSGNGCTSFTTPVTAHVTPAPAAPVAANVSICSGSATTLSANGAAGVVYNWYDVPTGGTSLITSPDFTTPALTASKTYYVQVALNGCLSLRTPVSVTVNPIPKVPVAADAIVCFGTSAILSATADGSTHQWFASAESQIVLFTGDTYQTPALTKTRTYYVKSVNGDCSSAKVVVTVNVNPIIPVPSASGQFICMGSTATLSAKAQQGTLEWYDAATGGNLLSANAVFTTPQLSANAVYYIQAVKNGCASLRLAVQVTVLPLPVAPQVAPQTVCMGNSATLTAAGSYSYQWYSAATGGNLLATAQDYTTPALSATATYYVQGISASGCVGPRSAVTVTVTPLPTAPTAQGATVCAGTPAILTANVGDGTVNWYGSPTGGTLLATGTTFTTPPILANTTYYAENATGQCTSTRTAVNVAVTVNPDPQFKYSSGTYCYATANQTPVIYTPAGGTFSATPEGLVFINRNTGEIDLGASKVGKYQISFTSNGPCSITSTTQVAVSNAPHSDFSYSGPYCQKATNPLPSFVSDATAGNFSATTPGLVFTNTTTGEINLAKSEAGTYTVINNINTLGGCPPVSSTNTVTIEPAPLVSAGSDQNVGTGTTSVQLAGSFGGASGAMWSGGKGSFSDVNSPAAIYTFGPGETRATLTLTTTDPPGICGPQSAGVTISIIAPPAAPIAQGAPVCPGSSATLAAIAPGGTYQWYSAPTGGALLATGAVFNTPALTATTNYYVQTTVNGVAGPRSQVVATVNNLTVTAPAVNACRGSNTTLTASGSTGSYQWFDSPAGGNLLSTSSTYTTPVLIVDTAYYVQSVVGSCIGSRIRVPVTVNQVPAITSAELVNVCSGSAPNYTITADVPSTTFSWSRAAVAGISNPEVSGQTASIINEPLINTGNAQVDVVYVIKPFANGCPGTSFNLTVTVYPPAIVSSPVKQNLCNGLAPGFAIQFTTPPTSFAWSRAAVSGISNAPVSNQAAPSIREILNNTTNKPINVKYAYTINTISCPATGFDYIVTVNPTANITSAGSATICSGSTVNYTITSDVDSVNFVWSRGAVGEISNPPLSNQTSKTINETLINISDHDVFVYYYITPYLNGCAGNAINYTVRVNAQPAVAVIKTNSPVCLNSTIRLNTLTIDGLGYLWTGPNGFTSTLQNPTIDNVTKANAGTYTLTEIRNGCSSSISSVEVLVDDYPIANAGSNQTVCTNQPAINLNGKISGGTTTGVWTSNGSGSFSPANNVLNAQYIPSAEDENAGSVVLNLVSTSKDDCHVATSSITLTFQQAPIANAGGNKDVCTQDVTVKLSSSAKFANHVVWATSGTGKFLPSDTVVTPLYIQSAADIAKGSVTLSFRANNAYCTSNTDQAVIRFIPPPTISAGFDKFVIKGQPLTLNPKSSEANVHYSWAPKSYLNNDTLKNAVVTGTQDITYTLTVTDARGCVSEDRVNIKVLDALNIPNTFTPNGDQINDTWNIPALNKYPSVTVDVYSRDGHAMFHSDGYRVSWDGTYNGTPLPVGVYYYVIDTKFQDIKLAGPLTIIR